MCEPQRIQASLPSWRLFGRSSALFFVAAFVVGGCASAPKEPELFQDMEKAEVQVDPADGISVEYRKVRAFREDIEREGVPASRIFALGEDSWFGGVTASPTSDRVAFAVVERLLNDKNEPTAYATIRSVGGSGGGIAQLTTRQRIDTDPAFSHDGEQLYFVSNRLRGGYLELFRINSRKKGGGITKIHGGEGWCRSPSNQQQGLLAFDFRPHYIGSPSTPHIWTIGGESEFPTQLIEGAEAELSPDGKEILYIGPDDKLWKFSLETGSPVQLTTDPKTRESDPTWSRDGRYIIFISDEGLDSTGEQNNDLWIMQRDGLDRRQLTTNGSDDIDPSVSFDQRWIFFVSNRGYKWAIWRIPWPTGLN